MRQDGSTPDPEATNAAARDDGPTRRTVHADGSVSVLAEESRDLSGDSARARTEALRREEAIPEVLRIDRDLAKVYLADIEDEINEALEDPEAFAAQEAEDAADLDALADAAAGEPDDPDVSGDDDEPDGGGEAVKVEPTPPTGGDPGGSPAAASPSGGVGPDDYSTADDAAYQDRVAAREAADEDPKAALYEAISAIPTSQGL